MAQDLTEEFIESESAWVPWSGCLIWLRRADPYARYGRSVRLVHRYLMERYLGRELGRYELVMHTCDIPSCVNIKHLRLGSPSENSADMVRKKRSASGERNPNSKLTVEEVKQIKESFGGENWSPVKLARKFGVSAVTIWNVVHRDWKDV